MVDLYSQGVQGVPNPVMPMGRIVSGHPMLFTQEKDSMTKQPKFNAQNQPKMSCYFGFAIPKGGEQHWNQTPWGALIWQEGANVWPALINQPNFSWKIVDGDSSEINQAGVAWNSKEGYPGHWVLNISSSLSAPKCFKNNTVVGGIQECVTDKDIKTGDYGWVTLSVKDNRNALGVSQRPGVYINPLAFWMDVVGQEIVATGMPTGNAAMFGKTSTPTATATPAYQAPVQQQVTPAYQPPVQQNTTWQNPPPPTGVVVTPPPAPTVRMVSYNGQTVKADDLLAGGWTEAQIAQHTTPAV